MGLFAPKKMGAQAGRQARKLHVGNHVEEMRRIDGRGHAVVFFILLRQIATIAFLAMPKYSTTSNKGYI